MRSPSRTPSPQRTRRELVKAAEADVYDQVMTRDGYACILCGTRDRPTLQHIRPRGMGGTRHPIDARLGVVLHGSGTTGCHGAVEIEGRRDGWAYPLGYLLREGTDLWTLRDDPDAVHTVWGHHDRVWYDLTHGGVRTATAARPAPDLSTLRLVEAAIR